MCDKDQEPPNPHQNPVTPRDPSPPYLFPSLCTIRGGKKKTEKNKNKNKKEQELG
jgi:hypothetical protein